MKYIKRTHEERIFKAFETQSITCILGPRRVGKSTLINHYLDKYHEDADVVRLNMDRMSEREQIKSGALEKIILNHIQRHFEPNKQVWVMIDEAQKCPEVFDQVKILYDTYKDQGAIKFILTGSALLELHRLSAESLAGRIQLFYLSAFNLAEAMRLKHNISIPGNIFNLVEAETQKEQDWADYFHELSPYIDVLKETLLDLQLWGGLPEVLMQPDVPSKLEYLGNYLQTYLEKDVRAVESITDLTLYRNILDVVAEQTGSIRDDSRIIKALGCHRETLRKYRGYLEATLMYQDVHPYINSTLRRLVKSPKGYLVNNGLISFISGLYDLNVLAKTGQMGHRLENWFLNELQVWLNKTPGKHDVNYWRTTSGTEVDFIVKRPPQVFPFEVTCSQSIELKKIRNLLAFREYEAKTNYAYYIHMGEFKFDAVKKIIFIPAWGVLV
jgi:uncharacterized protein